MICLETSYHFSGIFCGYPVRLLIIYLLNVVVQTLSLSRKEKVEAVKQTIFFQFQHSFCVLHYCDIVTHSSLTSSLHVLVWPFRIYLVRRLQ